MRGCLLPSGCGRPATRGLADRPVLRWHRVRHQPVGADGSRRHQRGLRDGPCLGARCAGGGYIGDMTFIVALLREQGLPAWGITGFYTVLGFAVMASGLLFGAVFLLVVASTTAWVRHNLPANQWTHGIGAFTIVFASGQIVGRTVVGWIADGPGGLERGFVVSALALWLGAALALRQRAHRDAS